jgi:hypothetical protein
MLMSFELGNLGYQCFNLIGFKEHMESCNLELKRTKEELNSLKYDIKQKCIMQVLAQILANIDFFRNIDPNIRLVILSYFIDPVYLNYINDLIEWILVSIVIRKNTINQLRYKLKTDFYKDVRGFNDMKLIYERKQKDIFMLITEYNKLKHTVLMLEDWRDLSFQELLIRYESEDSKLLYNLVLNFQKFLR